MSGVFVRGIGAVSPAGWGVQPMFDALREAKPIPTQHLPGPKAARPLWACLVPPAPASLPLHPRLRRASVISRFALAAASEALQGWRAAAAHTSRLGIVVGVHTACIRYSERFFGEVCRDPATASPMLFPETVMNAPASHLAACLAGAQMTYTIVGDQSAFVQALVVAAGWLLDDRVDCCLVVSAEEAAWPIAVGLRHFAKGSVAAEGAGALLLAREPGEKAAIALERITDAHLYAGQCTRQAAAKRMRDDFPLPDEDELLVDGRSGVSRLDQAESDSWQNWPGPRLSPRVILGEAMSAATAWQFVSAARALEEGPVRAASISVVGSNQQAIGARLIRL